MDHGYVVAGLRLALLCVAAVFLLLHSLFLVLMSLSRSLARMVSSA